MSERATGANIKASSESAIRPAFAVLATVQATLIFTIALIMIPLPKIAAQFALSEPQILLLQVAYGLPFSGLLLFGGRLTDRYAARRMFTIGLMLFGAASLVASLAPRFDVLIAMRFLQGVGGAAMLLIAIWGEDWVHHPSVGPALAVGIATVIAPFFLMQPAMGLGVAASKTPKPSVARLRSLVTHAVFGMGLFGSAWLLAQVLRG